MKFNLTNIKTKKSRNGYAMTATFLINNTPVAEFSDKGDGSQPSFYIKAGDNAINLFAEWEIKLQSLPEIYVSAYDMNMKIDKSLFIDMLHAALVNKTEFKLLA